MSLVDGNAATVPGQQIVLSYDNTGVPELPAGRYMVGVTRAVGQPAATYELAFAALGSSQGPPPDPPPIPAPEPERMSLAISALLTLLLLRRGREAGRC